MPFLTGHMFFRTFSVNYSIAQCQFPGNRFRIIGAAKKYKMVLRPVKDHFLLHIPLQFQAGFIEAAVLS